jgi:hypothetical protein
VTPRAIAETRHGGSTKTTKVHNDHKDFFLAFFVVFVFLVIFVLRPWPVSVKDLRS